MGPKLTLLSLSAMAVAIAACSPQLPYARQCSGIALGTPVATLPATRVQSGIPGLGSVLHSEPNWSDRCRASCAPDSGCARVDLPDGGSTLDPQVCGEHYAIGSPYRGENCNFEGIVEHCDVWVRDGGVIASHAFCQD